MGEPETPQGRQASVVDTDAEELERWVAVAQAEAAALESARLPDGLADGGGDLDRLEERNILPVPVPVPSLGRNILPVTGSAPSTTPNGSGNYCERSGIAAGFTA